MLLCSWADTRNWDLVFYRSAYNLTTFIVTHMTNYPLFTLTYSSVYSHTTFLPACHLKWLCQVFFPTVCEDALWSDSQPGWPGGFTHFSIACFICISVSPVWAVQTVMKGLDPHHILYYLWKHQPSHAWRVSAKAHGRSYHLGTIPKKKKKNHLYRPRLLSILLVAETIYCCN